MTITIKTPEEIEVLRAGGKRLAFILKETAKQVAPGVSTKTLNDFAHNLMIENGDEPAFLDYQPYGAKRPYPASLCVSVNDEVVHGIPNEENKILKEGDIVSLDAGLKHQSFFTDMAITVPVGKISEENKKLLKSTREALEKGISAARPYKKVSDISRAIENHIKIHSFGIVEELSGHGVGYNVHEDPYIPNYTIDGPSPTLKVGMVLAIEPIINLGSKKVFLSKDGYTYKTKDGKPSAHFEHTIVITEKGADILTR